MQEYTADGGSTHAGHRIAGWAGTFECSVCRRKRLVGAEFSKKMLEKGRAGAPMKCKQCVAQAQQAERDAAAKKREAAEAEASAAAETGAGSGAGAAAAAAGGDAGGSSIFDAAAMHECAACKKMLPATAFNKTQLRNKGPGKQRCIECVSAAVAQEDTQRAQSQAAALKEAKAKAKKAEATGNAAQKLVASSALAAAEAELVTGLKPVKLGRGGRGGRGHGRGGSWRARSRGRG